VPQNACVINQHSAKRDFVTVQHRHLHTTHEDEIGAIDLDQPHARLAGGCLQ
jgi:hypothetical protein